MAGPGFFLACDLKSCSTHNKVYTIIPIVQVPDNAAGVAGRVLRQLQQDRNMRKMSHQVVLSWETVR